jgi:hypothetical protein
LSARYFYDSGEVSGDGRLVNAAITTDYNGTWRIGYRGQARLRLPGHSGRRVSSELGQADVNAPATGYMWDNLASHGLTCRDYSEYIAVCAR